MSANGYYWVDGKVVPIGTPCLRADDTGFLLGLSVFDTVLCDGGCLFFLEDHLARLERGATELSIPWPPPFDPTAALHELADALAASDGDWDPAALRMTLSRGPEGNERGRGLAPTFVITPRRAARPADPGVVCALAAERRMAGDPLGRLKSTNRLSYVLAREEVVRRGAWEALFVSDDGDVLEGTLSNVFCVTDGELRTPPVERGCLAGTLRGRILAELSGDGGGPPVTPAGSVPVAEARIELGDLERATEVFLTNTTGRVIPVVEVQGVTGRLPGSAGPVTRAVRERVRSLEARYREAARR